MTIRMRARTNGADLVADLEDFERAADVAVLRTVNKVTEQAMVAGLRQVAKVYRIGPRQFERYMTVRLATAGELEASISAKGVGLPLYLFNPRPSQPGPSRSRGVIVTIKGERVLIEGAFIARMRSGRIGVFMRGGYGGRARGLRPTGRTFGRFVIGRGRLPINELYTFGPSEAFGNDEVVDAMSDRIDEQFGPVFTQELRFALRGRPQRAA